MDRKAGEGIWGAEGKIYKRTGISSTGLRQKNEDGSRCVRLCYRDVLSMECKDRKWRLVAFLSKSPNETESNYEIHNKEMLAVIIGLENWKHILESAKYKFEIWTDYKNLEYLMKEQKLNQRHAH